MSAAYPTSFQVNSRRTSGSSCCKIILYYANYKYIGNTIYLMTIGVRSRSLNIDPGLILSWLATELGPINML